MSDLYKIPIIENSAFDLSKLDFSFINFCIVNVESDYFKSFLNNISKHPDTDLDFIYKNLNNNGKSVYSRFVILNTIKNNIFSYEDVFKFLMIINCSLLLSNYIVYSTKETEKMEFVGIQNLIFYAFEQELIIEEQIDSINAFSKKYFENYSNNSLIKKIVDNYYNCFLTDHQSFQYISLYTCLENLVLAGAEQAYRMQRICAILITDDFKSREKMFKNIGVLKTFRNELVHGGTIKNEKLSKNLFYLRNLVAMLIIRMFFIDNEIFIEAKYNITIINQWITTVGYSERLFVEDVNCFNQAILNIEKNKKINIDLQ